VAKIRTQTKWPFQYCSKGNPDNEDENFVESLAAAKSVKITLLKNLHMYVYSILKVDRILLDYTDCE